MTQYFPPSGTEWERTRPDTAGFNTSKLADAVAFAKAHESPWPRSMYLADGSYIGTAEMGEVPPASDVLGEVRERGGASGLILRGGRIVAEWGQPARVDVTFSVAKSYLAILAGIALRDGLIGSVDDPVHELVRAEEFAAPQNRSITWRHLLQQTSEWEGTLWGKPELVDRNRHVGPGSGTRPKGTHRDLEAPGSFWEYNDVRVNLLSFCLMQLFRRPLPDVLRAEVMGPIDASRGWAWRGYRTSTVEVDGRPMESVSGGSHWGGGLFISSYDHARLGLLVERGGAWNGRQIIPPSFIEAMQRPCEIKPIYGFMWWLNTARGMYPSAPESSIFALGMGTNLIWIDTEHDLVAVLRWIQREEVDRFIAQVMAALA